MCAFNSADPSSNPAEAYSFSVKCCVKRTKINRKEAGIGEGQWLWRNCYHLVVQGRSPGLVVKGEDL